LPRYQNIFSEINNKSGSHILIPTTFTEHSVREEQYPSQFPNTMNLKGPGLQKSSDGNDVDYSSMKSENIFPICATIQVESHRKNSSGVPRNKFTTDQVCQFSMSKADHSAKKLAYQIPTNGTASKHATVDSKGQYESLDMDLTIETSKTGENVTPVLVTSEKTSYSERTDKNRISSQRFQCRTKPTIAVENLSQIIKMRTSVESPCDGPITLSSSDKNIRSFIVAFSNVAKKEDMLIQKRISKSSNSTHFENEETRENISSCSSLPSPSLRRPTSSSGLTLSAFRRPEVSVRLTDCPVDSYIHQTYHVNRVLGHGASSTVRLAIRRSDGKKFAVKCIPKYTILREKHRLDELALLKALQHPNIVSLIDVFETENEIQLVMEYCPGGELFDAVLGKKNLALHGCSSNYCGYSEKDAAKIISSLLRALRYLHFLGIVHRDVKPENILLMSSEDGETDVKLSDFGTARVLHPQGLPIVMGTPRYGPFLPDEESDVSSNNVFSENPRKRSRAYSRVGSDFYVAPEVHSGKGYDTSADLYSLGVTMYIILFGRFPSMPFEISSANDMHWKHISAEAKDLLQALLESNPARRITAAKALHHDWIVQNNKVEHKRSFAGLSKEDGSRIAKKARLIDVVDMDLSLFDDSNIYGANDVLLIVDEREDDDSSMERPLRPTCFV